MVKLRDKMGTCYFTVDHVGKLNQVLAGLEGQEVDLAFCRFTPGAERILARYYSKIDFHNTEHKELEELLQRNTEAARMPAPKEVELKVDLSNGTKLIDNIRSLDVNTIYHVTSLGDPKLMAFVILVMLKRPKIQFDLGGQLGLLVQEVRRYWEPAATLWDKYWELSGEAMIVRNFPDEYVTILGDGIIKKEAYVARYKVFPYVFGTDAEAAKLPEFETLYNTMVDRLMKVTKVRRIKDMLEEV